MRCCVLAVPITACTVAEAQRPPSAGGTPEHHSDNGVTCHILKPVELPAPAISQLCVPTGFRNQMFAENIGNARILAIGPNGNGYVTQREEGDVLIFGVGADGLAAGEPVQVASLSGLHRMAFSKTKVYLAAVHEIYKADVHPDGTVSPLEMIIRDLPGAVHGVVRDIPAAVSALREGLASLDHLEDLMGLRKGPNTAAGSVGSK